MVWGADCTSPPTCDRCGCKRKVEVGQKKVKWKKWREDSPVTCFTPTSVLIDISSSPSSVVCFYLFGWGYLPGAYIHYRRALRYIRGLLPLYMRKVGWWRQSCDLTVLGKWNFRDLTYFRARCSSPLPHCLTSPNPPRSKGQHGQLGIEPASLQVRMPPGYLLPDICYRNYIKHKINKWSLGTDD